MQYQRYSHQYQADYIRTKLRCVRMCAQSEGFGHISSTLGVHTQSAREYVKTYLAGGFDQLCQPTTRQQPCLLNNEQAAAFKEVLLTRRPEDVGLEGNLWTGQLIRLYLDHTYGVI